MTVNSIAAVGPPGSVTTQSKPNQETASERRSLASVARVVNESKVLGEGNELVFTLDASSHRMVARILDRTTQQVLEQLPPEYILRLAQELSGKAITAGR